MSENKARTYRELYDYAFDALSEMPMPDLETRELITLAGRNCGDPIDPNTVQSRYREIAPPDAYSTLIKLLERRLCGEPLAYLLGEWDFCGFTLWVDKRVLVPRSDTETVALKAVKTVRERKYQRVLDLCCGSGCIGLAVLHHTTAHVTLADISEDVLDVARENVALMGFSDRAEVTIADALDDPSPALGMFDLIVSNPPYISADEMSVLDAEVAAFEPSTALYGGQDGLNFYRAIAGYWKAALKLGGALVLEIGAEQAEDVRAILLKSGYINIETGQDLAGHDRVVTAYRE